MYINQPNTRTWTDFEQSLPNLDLFYGPACIHLDLDWERIDQVLWDVVGVSRSIDTHGDKFTLEER